MLLPLWITIGLLDVKIGGVVGVFVMRRVRITRCENRGRGFVELLSMPILYG